MRTYRLRRWALARRLSIVFSLVTATPVLALAPDTATIAGQVLDPQNRPVRGAQVIVTTSIDTAAATSTDAEGRFTLDVSPGSYELRVAADGFVGDPITIAIDGGQRRTVEARLRVAALAESVLVSASQVGMPLSQAADTATVITGADLEARQVETVTDALRTLPGLTVARSGGRGALTSLFPRGGGSNYTLVLVDGIRANAFGGGADFGHFAFPGIDRVEIVRGPQSALYGSDAIGGVVQIVTRRGGPTRASAMIEGGNQSTARVLADASGSSKGWSWGGGIEHSQTDGFTGVAPATGETVSNDDDRLTRGSGTLGWQRQGGAEFVVSGNVGRDERGFPGPFGSNPIGAFTGVDRVSRGVNDTRQIGGHFSHPWNDRARQRIDLSYANIDSHFTSEFGPSESGSGRADVRIQEDIAVLPALSASAGLDVQRERGSSSFVTGANGDALPIHRGIAGLFGEARYSGVDRLSIVGGARLEHLHRDALEADAFGSRPAFPDQTVDSFNPKIAASYVFARSVSGGAATRVRASAGTGIRPPDTFEIAFTDNPNLKPERSRSFDAGVEQQFAGGAYAVAATMFYNRYDDLLVTVGRSLQQASHYKTDNISNALARGFELSADARVIPALTLRASYTFLATEILSVDGLAAVAPPPFKVGDPLIRRPRHQGAVSATYAAGRMTVFGELTGRGETLDIEPNFGASGGLFPSPGYGVVNAGASFRLTRVLDLYGRVLNLGDRQYEETLGFPALRQSGVIGVRIAAGR